MKYPWLEEELLAFPGARREYKVEWEWLRFLVGGKMFAAICRDREGREVVTLKMPPLEGEFLREQFPGDIAPGHYMNKAHWNSVRLDGGTPDEVLRHMIQTSYRLVFEKLPRAEKEKI